MPVPGGMGGAAPIPGGCMAGAGGGNMPGGGIIPGGGIMPGGNIPGGIMPGGIMPGGCGKSEAPIMPGMPMNGMGGGIIPICGMPYP
jgi:hypothetical protein